MNHILKRTLEKAALKFEADEDQDYTFALRNGEKRYNCLAVVYPAKHLIVFNAAWELPIQTAKLPAKFFEVLNSINFRLTSGNLEFDGDGTVIFRMPCFLPEQEDAAAELCLNVLKKFMNTAKRVLLRLEKDLNFHSREKSVSDAEIDICFSHWRKQMEKELDWLYSSDCSLPGKERSEKILNMELLVKLFDKPENRWR